MSLNRSIPVVLLLAGCTASPAGMGPAAAPPATSAGGLALTAVGPLAESVAADGAASLPFRSLVEEYGIGSFLLAGADERVVLHGPAELDALLARHPRVLPDSPIWQVRPPGAPPLPPEPVRPAGVPTPEPVPVTLPELLTGLDWSRWQAIAFVDGQVDTSATSRITGVIDRGDQLEVRTARWVAPPGPLSAPAARAQLHVIAIPRDDRPITFAPTTLVDGSAKPGPGGGYGGGTTPAMSPKWRAVPNPLVTREAIEASFRLQVRNAATTAIRIEKGTVAWAEATYDFQGIERYTPDSEVWVGIADGDLPSFAPNSGGPGPAIGASPPRMSQLVAVYSIEDERVQPSMMRGQPVEADPGFRFALDFYTMWLHVGDSLRFTTTGQPPAGSAKVSLTLGTAAPVVREVPFRDLATFALPIDGTTLPGLTDAEVQTLKIEASFDMGGGQPGSVGREVRLIRDPEARGTPVMRIGGPPSDAEYQAAPGETPADAFVRGIAATDWGGRDLVTTVRDATYGTLRSEPPYAFTLPPTTPVKVYEVRGTFPKTLIPAVQSGRGVEEVVAPRRLVVAVTTQLPVTVVGFDAYAE